MEVFTDNTDSSFTDTEVTETPVEPMPPGNPDTSDNTTATDGTEIIPSPAPVENEDITAGDGQEQQQEESKTYSMDEIYRLLDEWKKAQEDNETTFIENQEILIEQSKHQLSLSYLSILTIGFLSGILLAKVVWRKL